jgi:hypothetical protein
MEIEQYLLDLDISNSGILSEDGGYVVDIENSDEFGKVYSKLEKADDLIPLVDSQVITLQGSSFVYESETEPFILNLIADFDNDRYQLVVTRIGE